MPLPIPPTALPNYSRFGALSEYTTPNPPARSVFPAGWVLSDLAANHPDALLADLNVTCQQWDTLSNARKHGLLNSYEGQRFGRFGEYGVADPSVPTGPSVQNIRSVGRRPQLATATPVVSVFYPADVDMAITILDRHCYFAQDFSRPAGQAAPSPYTTASSYTNGPTLLAAAVAFAGGYAVAHFTARRKR